MIGSPEGKSAGERPSVTEIISSMSGRAVQALRGLTRSQSMAILGVAIVALTGIAGRNNQDRSLDNHNPALAISPAENFPEFSLLGMQMRECNGKEEAKINSAFAALRIGINLFMRIDKEKFIELVALEGDPQSGTEAGDLYDKLPQLLKYAEAGKTHVNCGFLNERTSGALISEWANGSNIAVKTEPPEFVNNIAALAGTLAHELTHKHDFYGLHGHAEDDGLDLPYRFGLILEMVVKQYEEENN